MDDAQIHFGSLNACFGLDAHQNLHSKDPKLCVFGQLQDLEQENG